MAREFYVVDQYGVRWNDKPYPTYIHAWHFRRLLEKNELRRELDIKSIDEDSGLCEPYNPVSCFPNEPELGELEVKEVYAEDAEF